MIFESDQTYYELLEVTSDASSQEIKNSYLRIKAAYRKDNLALYSLHEASESSDILERIEEAYQILHDPEKRRDYDARHAFTDPIERDEIVSIDRVPPMETSDETDLLVPPSTDFELPEKNNVAVRAPDQTNAFSTSNISDLESTSAPSAAVAASTTTAPESKTSTPTPTASLPQNSMPGANEHENVDWTGSAIRKVRESKRYSLDDISTQTRISKTYLQAIEDEAFDKLPAPVFVRGFIIQYAKFLKIPHDAAAQFYMARFKKAV